MTPFMDGVELPQGYSHFKEAVYFLPISSQKFPLWPNNADFVIFMQFLAILPKLSPHQSTLFGKPCLVGFELRTFQFQI